MSDPQPVSSPQAEAFYANAYKRILKFMAVIPAIAVPAIWIEYGRATAFGFIAGCLIALFNFYWLKRTVAFLADTVISTGRKQSGAGVVAGFFLRYFLIAAAAYAILRGSAASVYGLFGGLFLPVGAILIEAAYETYGALRR